MMKFEPIQGMNFDSGDQIYWTNNSLKSTTTTSGDENNTHFKGLFDLEKKPRGGKSCRRRFGKTLREINVTVIAVGFVFPKQQVFSS